MNKLSRTDIQKLEEYWINHKHNTKNLKFREWELTKSVVPDENIGAGSNSVATICKPTEKNGIKLADDKLYNNLKTIVTTIGNMYTELNDDEKTIIDMRYWCKDPVHSDWEDIAYELGYTRSKTLRIRNGILNETAKRIGYV